MAFFLVSQKMGILPFGYPKRIVQTDGNVQARFAQDVLGSERFDVVQRRKLFSVSISSHFNG